MRLSTAVPLALVLFLVSCATQVDGSNDLADTSSTDAVDLQDGVADVPPADLAGDLDLVSDVDLSEVAEDVMDVSDTTVDTGPDAVDATDLVEDLDTVDPLAWVPACSVEPCPIVIDAFPYTDSRNTNDSIGRFDAYSCAPTTDESGPEFPYVFRLEEPGTVIAMITDGSGVDIDIHLLDPLDADACRRRNNLGISAHLAPGIYYLVADTYVNASGAQAGLYTLDVHFIADSSPCAMRGEDIPRIGTTALLPMPATGMIVKEAHLLTAEEAQDNIDSGMANFPTGWPNSFWDGIPQHYALSQAASGFSGARTEPWAPCCEPSNEYGQGSTAKPPLEAEAWYLNMRWSTAPPRGERYIVFEPVSGKAVVAAAGYENGPGDLTRVGGAAEEIHLYLGTQHLDTLTFGAAVNLSLPYGPIDCNP